VPLGKEIIIGEVQSKYRRSKGRNSSLTCPERSGGAPGRAISGVKGMELPSLCWAIGWAVQGLVRSCTGQYVRDKSNADTVFCRAGRGLVGDQGGRVFNMYLKAGSSPTNAEWARCRANHVKIRFPWADVRAGLNKIRVPSEAAGSSMMVQVELRLVSFKL
jgi:hypothetical protein